MQWEVADLVIKLWDKGCPSGVVELTLSSLLFRLSHATDCSRLNLPRQTCIRTLVWQRIYFILPLDVGSFISCDLILNLSVSRLNLLPLLANV